MKNYNELFIATTDTVTGIGAPVSEDNKKAINTIKRSPLSKRLVILVSSIEMAKKFPDFNNAAEKAAEKFWPGATTIICSDKLALRMPNCLPLQDFIEQTGPIYMTSANFSGENTLEFEKAKEIFQEVEDYYDFGKGSGKPSRIYDVKTKEWKR